MKTKSVIVKSLQFIMCITLLSGVIGFGFSLNVNAEEVAINRYMNEIGENINKKIQSDPILSLSSNPYDYIRDDNAFNELIKLGPEIVPILYNRIVSSENNGLQEYIYAIAAEEILQLDLKEISIDGYKWADAKTWSKSFSKFSNDLERNLFDIQNSNYSEIIKSEKIKELGIQAIPLIKSDNIDKKDKDNIIKLNEFMKNSKK